MEGPPTSGNKGSDRSSERWCAGEARVSIWSVCGEKPEMN